jgi:hypothetical protein
MLEKLGLLAFNLVMLTFAALVSFVIYQHMAAPAYMLFGVTLFAVILLTVDSFTRR